MPKRFEYIAHHYDSIYIVWLNAVNRYILFREPAFRLMEKWADGAGLPTVARFFSKEYELPFSEALRFTKEVTTAVSALFPGPEELRVRRESASHEYPPETPFSVRYYRIYEKTLCFKFGVRETEDFLHPLFDRFGLKNPETAPDATFELTRVGEEYLLRTDSSVISFPLSKPEEFQGAVCLELTNAIHNKKKEDWMGVLHASGVSDGENALLFVAPPGSGKSSMAALMLSLGYYMLSDDFLPVAMQSPEIYPFPAGISVKSTALEFMQTIFPSLSFPNDKKYGSQDDIYEVYMPLPDINLHCTPAKTKAIVFVQYDPSVSYELIPESNAGVLNEFLDQAWIAGTPAAFRCFMKWYFNLPVYRLRYSDNTRAAEGMEKLLRSNETR